MRFGQGVQLLANPARLLRPAGQLLAVTFQFLLRDQRDVIGGAGIGEEGLQAVIIRLADRVVLVVVTAGAGDGEAEEHCGRGIGDVIENFLAALHQVASVAFVRVMPVEGGGDPRIRVVGKKFIAGDLVLDEAVVGFVGVERFDHEVCVPRRSRVYFHRKQPGKNHCPELDTFACRTSGSINF